MLSTIPVYAVMVEDLGERGAEYMAVKLLREFLSSQKPRTLVEKSSAADTPQPAGASNVFVLSALALGVALGFGLAKTR